MADPGEGCASLPQDPDACLRLKFLHRQDRISLFNWLIFFFMRCALHFATKLNSRDIQKCLCFWVPSNDLFASAPPATGVHSLRNTWPSVCEVICHKKFQRSFVNQSLDLPPPPPPSKISGSAPAMEERFEFPFNLIGKSRQ